MLAVMIRNEVYLYKLKNVDKFCKLEMDFNICDQYEIKRFICFKEYLVLIQGSYMHFYYHN